MLSVGGEFGLALIAIALDSGVIDMQLGQIAITSVLLSMITGALLIRFNRAIAAWLARSPHALAHETAELQEAPLQQVVLGGYGRVGHTIAVLLHSYGVPFVAFDTDLKRVAQGRAERHAVWFGDIADPGLLASIHVERASLIVIAVDSPATALGAMSYISRRGTSKPVHACLLPVPLTLIPKRSNRVCASVPRRYECSMWRPMKLMKSFKVCATGATGLLWRMKQVNCRMIYRP